MNKLLEDLKASNPSGLQLYVVASEVMLPSNKFNKTEFAKAIVSQLQGNQSFVICDEHIDFSIQNLMASIQNNVQLANCHIFVFTNNPIVLARLQVSQLAAKLNKAVSEPYLDTSQYNIELLQFKYAQWELVEKEAGVISDRNLLNDCLAECNMFVNYILWEEE